MNTIVLFARKEIMWALHLEAYIFDHMNTWGYPIEPIDHSPVRLFQPSVFILIISMVKFQEKKNLKYLKLQMMNLAYE